MRLTADKVVSWTSPSVPAGVSPDKVYLGPDPFGLGGFQVAVAKATSVPSRQGLRNLFTARKGKMQIQLVVAVVHDGIVHLFGPDPQAQPIELPQGQAERQLQSVLAEPDVLAATERFAGFRKANDSTGVAGFTNSGLFASYHITSNVPKRSDWESLGNRAGGLLSKRGKQLIEALGFQTQPGPNGTMLLSIGEHPPRAIAVLLDDSEQFDAKTQRFQLSPVAFGLAVASKQEVPWLVVLRKDQIRLYPGRDGVGVGSKGQAETFFEVDLSTIDSEYAALLPLIFSADALAADGMTDELLRDSARYATELGARLRERIYDEIVPPVAVEVAQRLAKHAAVALDAEGLSLAYRVTLRILFRLLFQAYAEDRGLLPSGRNEGFDANSLKTNARRLIDSDSDAFGDSATIWFDLVQVWNAVDQGNPQWQIPSYNGGLFSTDPSRSPEGALIKKIELPDSVLGPALKSLLIDITGDGVLGPVDFRSLSVREFGTIYEGLLESSLSLAEEDLTVDSSGAWVPAKAGDDVYAASGSVYFHTASGERKATGSYFTPKVVVDHLIERSIVPALTAHLEKIAAYLNSGDTSAAAREFFDFRVADLAMGSGHFLVAAVDKIEALMRTFLTEHAVPGVTEELLRLAEVARDALGTDDVAKSEVDQVGLLRRQVARRCIYGLDINPMAVELARLALWIHTFVPGLPMSNLDHGLVNANSLTGIGTISEALDALVPGGAGSTDPIAKLFIDDALTSAKSRLVDIASASEATKAEVEESARMLAEATEAGETARRIFNAAVAARLGRVEPSVIFAEEDLYTFLDQPAIEETAQELLPAHMPYLFPEVFLRDDGGFDVLLGNPPWEKVKVETDQWWGLRLPGLRSMPQKQKNAALKTFRESRPDLEAEFAAEQKRVTAFNEVIKSGPFDLGSGDTDVYQAFAWRNWQLIRRGGRTGMVLPRSAMSGTGLTAWRKEILKNGTFSDVCFIENVARWAFDMEARYTIGLVVFGRGGDGGSFWAGPFISERELVTRRANLAHAEVETFLSLSSMAAFPLIPDPVAGEILRQMKSHPLLGKELEGFRYRVVRELDTANNKNLYDFDLDNKAGAPVATGATFNVWSPDHGKPYAYSVREDVEELLEERLTRQLNLRSSAFYGLKRDNLEPRPWQAARIAFRDVARATDSRTMIAALLPPGTFVVEKAPYFFRIDGSARTDAYLLGILSSVIFDWYSRRWVEMKISIELTREFPIPKFIEGHAWCDRVVEDAAKLAAVDARYEDWAAIAGISVGSVNTPSIKDNLIAELDALVSLLYGLTEDQVEHVFATFHRSWDETNPDYVARLDAVLKHYRGWKGEA